MLPFPEKLKTYSKPGTMGKQNESNKIYFICGFFWCFYIFVSEGATVDSLVFKAPERSTPRRSAPDFQLTVTTHPVIGKVTSTSSSNMVSTLTSIPIFAAKMASSTS